MHSTPKISQIGLYALLFVAAFQPSKTHAQESKATEACIQGAAVLANMMGARIGRTFRTEIEIQQNEIETFTYKCSIIAAGNEPAIIMEWSGRRKPQPATASYVARAAELFSGTNQDRFRRELDACIGASLRSNSFELREWGGTKIECKVQDRISWVMIWQKARR